MRIKDQSEDRTAVLEADYELIVGVLMVRTPTPNATLVDDKNVLVGH